MIIDLHISQLGAIDDVSVQFSPGLTVVTGETGAGKTMLVTSLHAVTGAKISSSFVRAQSPKAAVTVSWEIPDQECERELVELGGMVDDHEILLNRVIFREGRTKAYVGGQQIPIQKLAELTRPWITLHGQNDQLRLIDPRIQLSLIDDYGGSDLSKVLAHYQQVYADWKDTQKKYRYAQEHQQAIAQEKIQCEAIVRDLENIALESGELASITQKIKELTLLVEEQERCAQVAQLLTVEQETSVFMGLERAIALVEHSEHQQMRQIGEQLSHAHLLITEASAQLAQLTYEVTDCSHELEELFQRQKIIKDTCKKYYSTDEEIITLLHKTRIRLQELDGPGSSLEELAEHVRIAEENRNILAEKLHAHRVSVSHTLTQRINEYLSDLCMPDTEFAINFQRGEYTSQGNDIVTFQLVRANTIIPLHKSASGGELSRITLALELAFVEGSSSQTLVFDEIDTGVGGQAALAIGQKLQQLAHKHQVLVVTHLPQVAAFGHHHMKISKDSAGCTYVTQLDNGERINELARMLAGLADSASAQQHAQELLELAHIDISAAE